MNEYFFMIVTETQDKQTSSDFLNPGNKYNWLQRGCQAQQHYPPSSSVRREEEQLETEEGAAATVRRRGVHAAATVDLLNLPEIPAPSLLPCIVETKGEKLSWSCLTHRKGSFALSPECFASPGKGRTRSAIVGVAAIAPFVAELRRRRNNPPPRLLLQ
nr:hypothetical protein Itr_chr02CG20980 [Ipomoea trifida]GLL26632.1 hypothetical protein Itr_chr05CG06310 [Ipomoea trifida]GLL46127.1 hypothetical protein Itr_chr14CG07530 [Ipomoea trifida]GMD03681.1 hypothetical protein Iba_chr06aCG11200 [Ipomoea batatas]